MAGTRLFPHFLFANYMLEIRTMFQRTFHKVQLDSNTTLNKLPIYYGTPRAAFRYFFETFNGTIIYPIMNFVGQDYRRVPARERPTGFVSAKETWRPSDGTVAYMKDPMHFEITYNFNLFNNSYRERDVMVHKIMQLFPQNQVSIRWYPTITDPTYKAQNWWERDGERPQKEVFLFMPLKLEETSFIDETEVDGGDVKETRDVIRTSFNLLSEAILPYDMKRVPAVSRILFDDNIREEDAEYGPRDYRAHRKDGSIDQTVRPTSPGIIEIN